MLRVYTLEDTEKWDAIVHSFHDYDVYWLSGYVKTFQVHGDGDPILFFYDDGSTRGINVVMMRDIATSAPFKGNLEENCYFDIATPYGYGGWLIEGENVEKLFQTYFTIARARGASLVSAPCYHFVFLRSLNRRNNLFCKNYLSALPLIILYGITRQLPR